MNGREAVEKRLRRSVKLLERYKYVLLVLLAGLLLLLLPGTGEGSAQAGGTDPPAGETLDVEALERKLEDTLSQVEGAGEVTVVLTVKGSTRQVLAQDVATSRAGADSEESRSAVVVSRGSGQEEAVALQRLYPAFQGALVVCPGGGEPEVRLALTEAVSALTGLGSDKISICKREA
ncbi:MAG TPA: stage III sporulation protein AG [Candidatus Intestinimonas stercoravium]|uniref:stage III sporulation protein AG n=1 Tax=uncultured Intestinimonas sp. TaxID=1689265 RepID=UPI001F9290C9|nr:stage III sporulation protein AG [uncultured Intestinimonas sp.]HJA63360.1 stage III sporulation protein AG [Candidatus Intestinimonas stercoravium]